MARTRAGGGVIAGGRLDPCKGGLRTDVGAARSLHGCQRRAGRIHVAGIELRQPEIVANDRRVSTACEQRSRFARAFVGTSKQAPRTSSRDVSTFPSDSAVGGPRLVRHAIEEAQVEERAHPHDA